MSDCSRRDFIGAVAAAAVGAAGQEAAIDRYAAVVGADPELRAWWRFEGDLLDQRGLAPGVPRGEVAFVDGPVGGRALACGPGQWLNIGPAPHLDLPATTLELLFSVDRPTAGYNPALLGKRTASAETRFSVHVARDLSELMIWVGNGLARLTPYDGPLHAGRWYHLVVASDAASLRVWLDGVPLVVAEGRPFQVGQRERPLTLGASQPDGWEQCVCRLDEVAIYGRVLTDEQVAEHVAALGWAAKREQGLARQQAEREARWRAKEAALARRLADPALLARGEPQVYAGERLAALSLPVGGLGSGCLQMDGRAVWRSWQIAGNYRPGFVPHSFLAIRATVAGRTVVKALQTEAVGPFEALAETTFRGEYPFGRFDFTDPDLPLAASLEVFSPLIPLDARSSALPCAIVNVTLSNPGPEPVTAGLLASQQNCVGYAGQGPIDGRRHEGYGGNKNTVVREAGATWLRLTSEQLAASPAHGELVLGLLADEVTAAPGYGELAALRAEFAAGRLTGGESAGPSPRGETVDGALATGFTLAPGASRTLTVILAWHFPHVQYGSDRWGGTGHRYAAWWPDALAVARHVAAELPRLSADTRTFHQTLYRDSNLPQWLLDRCGSQLAILRSMTCFWTADGYFGGWEGCNAGAGCCAGNCGHVWHYAQAHARLFPELGRRMREQVLDHQLPDGGLPFRQGGQAVAADGQAGDILGAFREHLLQPDDTWLQARWPRLKRAMEFMVNRWDPERTGLLRGEQHNTLDGNLTGATSWLGSLYVAALRAAATMAERVGEGDTARTWRELAGTAARQQDERLYNGEYYQQLPDPQPGENYHDGCHIDQVLGEWWASQLDLGAIYPAERVRSALLALLKYNFQDNFHGLRQLPRKFVADPDAGMQMIVWPGGRRPSPQMRYADEVMSGFEYAAAATMIQAGLVREGFVVAKAVADRYDGRLRTGLSGANGDYAAWGYSGNPFGDDECGKFYARALSVWSLLLAAQGFSHDGPARRLGFRPVWQPDDHATFFSAGGGWGLYRQIREEAWRRHEVEVRYGAVELRELDLTPGTLRQLGVGDRPLRATAARLADRTRLTLTEPLTLGPGQRLVALLEPA